jgi:hypothetical protein
MTLSLSNGCHVMMSRYPERGDLPPASLEETEAGGGKKRECCGVFVREYPSQKCRNTFPEGRGDEEESTAFFSLPSPPFPQAKRVVNLFLNFVAWRIAL